MTVARTGHEAVLLGDGRVLIVGGRDDSGPLASAEVYDPVTGSFSVTGSMSHAREGYTATLLADGRVLIAGGTISAAEAGLPTPTPAADGEDVEEPPPVLLDSAEIYDPAAGAFRLTGSMATSRSGHSATLLRDGRVLVTGGTVSGGGNSTAAAEVYDPATSTFQPAGSMVAGRSGHTATLLLDGRVLVAGGDATPYLAEVYDPSSGAFTTTGSLGTPYGDQTATLLVDGSVLVAGASQAEIYDPASGVFTRAGTMVQDRGGHAATLLAGGRVLFTGGEAPDASAEIYDPTTGTFRETDSLFLGRLGHTATRLDDGRVLIAGGHRASGNEESLAEAELYFPDTGTFSRWPAQPSPSPAASTPAPTPGATSASRPSPTSGPTGWMTTPRSGHTATLLRDGRVLIAGGSDCAKEEPFEWGGWVECSPLASAELYDPATRTFSPTSPMTTVRGAHTAALLPDGRVLLVQVTASGDARSLVLAETYDPAVGTFSPAGTATIRDEPASVTVLRDGRVLLAGGTRYSSDEETGTESWTPLASAGIYDPFTGAYRPAGRLRIARAGHTATLLRDGRALITVGTDYSEGELGWVYLAKAEVYDPKNSTFSLTGRMRTGRGGYTATVLRDGRVLFAGGCAMCRLDSPLASAEIYDPRTGVFSLTGRMRTARFRHTATLLRDGRVLVTGGSDYIGDPYSAPTAAAEIYDPKSGTFKRTGSMVVARAGYAATLLADGRVLVTGGDASPNAEDEGPDVVASAEIYDPKTGRFTLVRP